jgi:aminoglycoside phosphotransferase (APT) family kinase protein
MAGVVLPVQSQLDLESLRSYLAVVLAEPPEGDLSARLVPGGRSNPTFEISDGAKSWILRRPPFGLVLPTAHDMAREYRVLSALRDSLVPVPTTLAYCMDPEVLGAPFYLMEKIEGVTMRNHADTALMTDEEQGVLADGMTSTLAALHEVNPDAVGLADFGNPQGFPERQVARWRKQWAAGHLVERPQLDLLFDRLGSCVPKVLYPGIIHGDFKVDNLMVDTRNRGRILGVLDWEMSTFGDTMADLGVFACFWDEEGRESNPVSAGTTAHQGFPTRDDALNQYANHRNIDLPNIDWYIILAYVKLAVILEQIHVRHVRGLTVGDGFDDTGAMVDVLIASACEWAAKTSVPGLKI